MEIWAGDVEPGLPYWWDDAIQFDLSDTPPKRCDILVIGAGYTGLSAAIAAHDAGATVCVVDAKTPGIGASSRNGGMLGAHPRLNLPNLVREFGEALANELIAEAAPALDFITNLIKTENIDCTLQQTGRLRLSYTAKQFEDEKQLARDVNARSHVKVEVVERTDLAAEIKTETYFGGIVFPDHCGLHPRQFHEGLLGAALRRKIAVVKKCPVTGLSRQVGGYMAKTPQGIITCDKVILATNGYTPDIFRWHQRRVFPLPSYIIATEPLDPDLINHLAPGRRMMVETRALHSYYRISPDGSRIVFGGRSSMRNIGPQEAGQRLRQTMLEIWPELADTKITHSWTGNTGYSFTGMPQVGENDGLHFAMGFSGGGTVMAPYLGAKAGLRAAGAQGGETAYASTQLRPRWLHPFSSPYFLGLADVWYRMWVDNHEYRARRR